MTQLTLQQRIERVRSKVRVGQATPAEVVALLDDLSAVVRAHEDRVNAALTSLTYSERMMLRHLIGALPSENGGRVVTVKAAAYCDASRAVGAQALRKLAAAGLATVRSMGQKGTHIQLHGITRTELLQRLGGAA